MSWWKRLFTKEPKQTRQSQGLTYPSTTSVSDEKYRPGQIWRYKTRPQDRQSTVLIGMVERLPRRPVARGQAPQDEIVISVQVQGLDIIGRGEEILSELSHLPLDRLALEASVVDLIQEKVQIPESFVEGYENWRRVFDRGAATYYKFPIAQCVELAERTFRSTARPRDV